MTALESLKGESLKLIEFIEVSKQQLKHKAAVFLCHLYYRNTTRSTLGMRSIPRLRVGVQHLLKFPFKHIPSLAIPLYRLNDLKLSQF